MDTPSNMTIINKTALTVLASLANTAVLHGIWIHTALAGTVTVGGFADDAGLAQNFVLPIATPAGLYSFPRGLINSAGALTVQLSSATDQLRVSALWRRA